MIEKPFNAKCFLKRSSKKPLFKVAFIFIPASAKPINLYESDCLTPRKAFDDSSNEKIAKSKHGRVVLLNRISASSITESVVFLNSS